MTKPPFASRLLAILLLFSVSVLLGADQTTPKQATLLPTDRPTRVSPIPKIEVRQVVDLMERYHYNRSSVRPSAYARVIPEFMEDLDGQKLFFLASDREQFEKKHGSGLYYNLRDLGNIDVAYDIFSLYEERVRDRLNWIFEELKKDMPVDSQDFYRIDRTKSDWNDTPASADELWRKRLRMEMIAELLNKKTPEKGREVVRKRYERWLKNLGDFENMDIGELFLSSFTRLFDPHSSYFSADTFTDFNIQMRLELIGIGAVLSIEDDTCVVKEIVPGGPADLDHRLKPNDKIIAVAQENDEPIDVLGMKLKRIVDQIRGKKGTKVRLIVQPADNTDGSIRREVVLTRESVKLNSARAHAGVFQVPGKEPGTTVPLGVISLPSFYGGEDPGDGSAVTASSDVAELIKRLKAEGVSGMVLDMRRNGGGLLGEAINITGLFIKDGPVVQVRDFTGKIEVTGDEDPSITYDGPLAVLVDRFSASASEIVAGALQNYGRAVIIGDSSTHGKGTVQQIIEMSRVIPGISLPAGRTGATKLTIQKFYLPSGASTQVKGVIPDITLPSHEDYMETREVDLKNPLVWDEIPTSFFEGRRLTNTLIGPLREASLKRQASLEEFLFLNKTIQKFKERVEQKTLSLNLEIRKKQKEADDVFEKEGKAERKRLEASNFAFKDVRIVPAAPPRIKAAKSADNAEENPLEPEDEDDSLPPDSYARLDVHLREALRVLSDALSLSGDKTRWKYSFAPLSAQAVKDNALAN